MTARGHLRLLATATAVWLGFFVAGLPDYYAQYSTRALLIFEVALLVPVGAAGWWVLRRRRPGTRLTFSVALAFHFTVPLFFYDFAWCGAHLGHGLDFLRRYWWLTAYYVVPWALFPATAALLEHGKGGGVSGTAPARPPAPAAPERPAP